MYAIRKNRDPDSRRWESGQPIGWMITIDGEWPYHSSEELRDVVEDMRVEEMRAMEVMS